VFLKTSYVLNFTLDSINNEISWIVDESEVLQISDAETKLEAPNGDLMARELAVKIISATCDLHN